MTLDVLCSLAAPFRGGRVGSYYVYKPSHTHTHTQTKNSSCQHLVWNWGSSGCLFVEWWSHVEDWRTQRHVSAGHTHTHTRFWLFTHSCIHYTSLSLAGWTRQLFSNGASNMFVSLECISGSGFMLFWWFGKWSLIWDACWVQPH